MLVPMSILFEACCSSLDDAIIAERAGAQRVELCSCLFFGGLTPSIGALIEAKKRLNIPVIVMIRPRGGGFHYTEAEFAQMLEDARLAVDHGADGLVFGCLTDDGQIDRHRTHALVEACRGKDPVFHRAFDVTPDPELALEILVELGVTRLLTSGQEPQALLGADLIKKLIAQARDRIEIMPGGGIHPKHVAPMIEQTGCRQIHLASWTQAFDHSTAHRPDVTFGGALYPPENAYDIADENVLRGMAEMVHKMS